MISSNAAGYAIFKQATPYLLQMAGTFPHLWAPDSALYISHALQCEQFEVRAFILVDTVASLAFGVPPLLVYDTTVQSRVIEENENKDRIRLLEWVYGSPADILLIMARVNAWRASRLIEPLAVASTSGPTGLDTIEYSFLNGTGPFTSEPEEWRTVERLLNCWTPVVEETDWSSNDVARLAVQESWRQAGFIYLYMVRHLFDEFSDR